MADVLRGRSIAVVLLTAVLALSSCGAHPAFHPGEADPARSRQVREEVRACAEGRGWHLDNLDLSVDAQGRLILISYRSRIIHTGTLEDEAVDSCLAEANVTQPPPGG